MTTSGRFGSVPAASLLKAARRLLRPLIGLMMQSGVTFPVLADMLRSLFVEVAVNDILTSTGAHSGSRISLLTGIHRKEIRRLRETPQDVADTPDAVTIVSQIVARWVATAQFRDADGRPRALPRTSAGPPGTAAFDRLVELVTTDVRPRAVLETLLSHGVVFVDAEDRVQLKAEAFIPRPGGDEQLFYFGRNLHDHVAAAAANIAAAGEAPFFDRSVHYDGLTPEQAADLQAYARAEAMRVLLDINRRAADLAEAGGVAGASQRVNFGIYIFNETETSGPEGTL